MSSIRFGGGLLLLIIVFSGGCGDKKQDRLVLYRAGDAVFSKQIMADFKKQTGLTIDEAGDTETSRGVALRTKIITEKGNPQADVYWNNELANTILLKKQGLLIPYKSPSAEGIPDMWRDKEGYWTAFGVRSRVFIVNTDLVKKEEMPTSMYDMADPKWKGKVGISKVTGGTTATHASALFEFLGDEKAKKYFADIKANEVRVCDGNGHVMKLVANGELHWGWTDTNDANVALLDKKPITVVYPDQGEDQIGTFLIPHSVSIVKGGPNIENAKKFVDYLLRKETEKLLAASKSVQVPVRKDVEAPAKEPFIMNISKIKNFNGKIDFERVAERLPSVIEYMEKNFN